MLGLYTLINSIIEPICNCYVGHYPEDQDGNTTKIYPYVEINFPNSTPNNSFSENNLLEISIWDDKSTDINEIETITDSIDKQLNKLKFIDSKMLVSIYRNTPHRLQLIDPIAHIQHRQLRYVVKSYYTNS